VISFGAVLTGFWFLSGAHFFWPVIPLTFLLMGLFRHAKYGDRPRGYHHHGHVRS
jgi:hypothetical protein